MSTDTLAKAPTYRVSAAVVARVVGDDTVLLNLESGVHHTLNEVAALLYGMAEGGADLDTIAARVCEQYEVELEQARQDALDFLDSEVAAGLLLRD